MDYEGVWLKSEKNPMPHASEPRQRVDSRRLLGVSRQIQTSFQGYKGRILAVLGPGLFNSLISRLPKST